MRNGVYVKKYSNKMNNYIFIFSGSVSVYMKNLNDTKIISPSHNFSSHTKTDNLNILELKV